MPWLRPRARKAARPSGGQLLAAPGNRGGLFVCRPCRHQSRAESPTDDSPGQSESASDALGSRSKKISKPCKGGRFLIRNGKARRESVASRHANSTLT